MDKYSALLKRLQTEETFEALTQLYGEMMEKWGKESPVRESEYETLKALFIIEGKKQGLADYFRAIETYHE